MHLPGVPDAAVMSARLNALADASVHSRAPGVLVAAVVHAELATIRPFARGSYLVARASSRMVLRARDCDRLGAASVEFGQFAAGRPAYAKALQAYSLGSVEGMVGYLEAYGDWVSRGIAMVSEQFEMNSRPSRL
jgi:Fic family protein